MKRHGNLAAVGARTLPPTAEAAASTWRSATLVYTVATLSFALHPLLTELAKDESGHLGFNVSLLVTLSEALKLAVTMLALARAGNLSIAFQSLRSYDGLMFALPALLYMCSNQLQFWMLLEMDPGTMQLLVNFKLVPVVLLSVMLLRRHVSGQRWLALLLLLLGTLLSHTDGRQAAQAGGGGGVHGARPMGASLLGLLEVRPLDDISNIVFFS